MCLKKRGPFKVPKFGAEYPVYAEVLAKEAEKLQFLPDLSKNKGIFVFSDFGGEHKGADFKTYSVLICSADNRSIFAGQTKTIREKHSLNNPWKEYSFKDLNYGNISRALDEFLDITNKYIHGLLLTISVDKNIESVFGGNFTKVHAAISKQFEEDKLGVWKPKEAEKLLRVCHAIGVFMSLIAHPEQKFMWLCDNDSINEDGKLRDFTHTQHVLGHCLSMYSENIYGVYGFAKPFDGDSETTDLLSVTDFSSGIIQEILQFKLKGKDLDLSKEKLKLAKWMGSESECLTKLNLYISKDKMGNFEVGTVDIRTKKMKNGYGKG